jgi:hypothetical protein
MGCQSVEGAYELYLLEALSGNERAELDAHLEKGCPHCLSHLREAAETVYWLTQSIPTDRPRPAVKARLWRRLQANRG